MIVLGIDTATPQVGCAIGSGDGPLASFHAARGRRHAETLAPAISFVCEQAGVALGELGAIAVDPGPGLFTGLRVGLATATALADALGLPMVAISSLDLLAHPHRHACRLVASVVDARRGEVFWALYRTEAGALEQVTDYAVDEPARVAAALRACGEHAVAAGDGARRYAGLLEAVATVEVAGAAAGHPSAAVLVELAHPLAEAGLTVRAGAVAPLYLRGADTRINWEPRPLSDIGAGPSAAAVPAREGR
jgi:tRNA threonylcarbamoyladenosine biosynthesis protein TsaB